MKKRILSLFIVINMLAGLIVTMPMVISAETEGVFTYTIANGEATITGCDTSVSGALQIPSTFGGYPVTAIGDYALFACENLTNVTIPDSVTTIGVEAFSCCDSLTNATIGNSVTIIGDYAFWQCDSLINIIIPDSVTVIGDYAFGTCTSLTNVTIPDNVTTIGDCAFSLCRSLTNVTIPDSVTTIGDYAFYCCPSLINIDVDGNNRYYSSLDGNLFNKNETNLIQYAAGKTNTFYTILDSVTTIGDYAFYPCRNLTNVTIPDSVTTIGDYAFFACDYLTNVTIPDSVTTIGDRAFSGCDSLTNATIGNSVTIIGDYAFWQCDSLINIIIPDSVTAIGDGAFQYCRSLTDVYYTGSKDDWKKIPIGSDNSDLTNATIHYNHSNLFVDKNKGSNSTTTNSPVIKSAKMKYQGKTYDIINQSVNIGKGSIAWADITIDIAWNGTPNDKQKVYLTQGASTDEKNNIFDEYSALNNTAEAVPIGTLFEADKPIYIMAVDESDVKNKSTAIATKINIIDYSKDEEYSKSVNSEYKIELGKDISLALPDDIPIIGGMELSWQLDYIPITIAYESSNKMSIAYGIDVATIKDDKKGLVVFEEFDFKEYKKNLKDAYKDQKMPLSKLRDKFKGSKNYKMSLFDGKVLSGGSGDDSYSFDVLGYAEVTKNNGKWDWDNAEGYLKVELKVEYEYNGQIFLYVIPCYYTFGGGIGAYLEIEPDEFSVNSENKNPVFDKHLGAMVELKLGAGIGNPKVASLGVQGTGALHSEMGISEEYARLWITAEAEMILRILGQEVDSITFAELDDDACVIYSTDPEDADKMRTNNNAVSLMSANSLYGGYSANNVYQTESRDYLESSMEWYGDMPTISLFAADYTNKNLTILADSVYPEAQPQIFSVGGTKILIFTADNDMRTANNKQMLVYSVYNDEDGTWSNAVPINDDGTADFYPSVSGEYLVWQNQKSVMGDGLSLAEIGKQGEIVIAKWNGNGFDAPVSLTDNDALDTLPKVSVNNNEISVVWLKNNANDILGVDGETSIVKKVYNGSAWGEEVVLKDNLNAVTDLSVGYCDNALNVAYVHDVDDDITTINDRELYLIGTSEKQVTDNEVLDSNAIINNGKLYWYSENNIHFMNLADSTKSTVFEDTRYALADGFTVSEDNGNIAILWSGSEDESSEIKGVLYQDGAWGDVITVSELGAYAKYPTCVLEEDGTILTSFTAEADGITSLYTLGLFPSYDLAISDIYFDEKTLALNSENEFEVMITNNGELPVEGYTINVYNENEVLNNSIVFEDSIKAGESKAVVGKFVTGDDISYENLKVEIALNADEEYVYDNNSMTLTIGNGDISFESLSVYEMLPTSYAVANVKNIGYSDISNITVNLRVNSADGEIVQSKTVSSLAAGSNEEVTFAYKPQDYENVKWYITIEAEANEVSVGNNHDYFINECAVGLKDYEISILNYSYADKELTVNAFAKNNIKDTLTADAVFAVYSSDGGVKCITTQPLSVGGYSDTGIDIWFENYTYASGDYVKMFMWSDLATTLKPLVNAEQVDVVIE